MAPDTSSYDLYISHYSICSIMVMYTVALRGKPKDSESDMSILQHEVDIFHAAQLTEGFLTEINPEGQVPVLINPKVLDAPIADSLKITLYMGLQYPDLFPDAHAAEIRHFLTNLHALNYFSLSFPGRPGVAQHLENTVLQRLENPDISARYRKALEFKLEIVQRTKVGGVVPAETERNVKDASELMVSLEKLVVEPNRWLFGEKPTALDAHLVVFIARMTDVGRENLIPEKLRQFGQWAMQGPEWTKVRDGRQSTMIPPGMSL